MTNETFTAWSTDFTSRFCNFVFRYIRLSLHVFLFTNAVIVETSIETSYSLIPIRVIIFDMQSKAGFKVI